MKSLTIKNEETIVFKRNLFGEFFELVDRDFATILFTLFFLGFFMINMIVETPPVEVDFINNVDFEKYARIAPPATKEPEPEIEKLVPEKKIKLEVNKDGINDAEQSRKSLGEEGRVGNKNSTIANTKGSSRKGIDVKVARSSGIMGVLKSGAASFDRIFGGGGLGAGLEKNLGFITGLDGVDQHGSGGLSVRGFATGGGGNAINIGGFNTRGRGGNPGSKYGMVASNGLKRHIGDLISGGNGAVIMGALDRSVIDSYIRRNLAKIRWCYEKELAKNDNIGGRVVINFTISGSGAVSTSKVHRTTMKNDNVENCIASTVRQIRFPSPKGGGIVVVNYPFVFKKTES